MLEIKNLDVAYGYAKVLHDISLKIETGQMAFIIGRNGAGKTTLLKTIIGLLKPKKGSIPIKEMKYRIFHPRSFIERDFDMSLRKRRSLGT